MCVCVCVCACVCACVCTCVYIYIYIVMFPYPDKLLNKRSKVVKKFKHENKNLLCYMHPLHRLSSLFIFIYSSINSLFFMLTLEILCGTNDCIFHKGDCGVMVIVVGNGHGDTSSNPGFHRALIHSGKVWIQQKGRLGSSALVRQLV